MALSRILPTTAGKCDLPFLDPNGHVVFFDVQSAEPGTFTIPGVIDLETYKPGDLVETSWIYFKGDPQAGPQPGHPLERPFNDTVKFSIDLVRGNDTSTVLREIMREPFSLLEVPWREMSTNERPQRPPTHQPSGRAARRSVDQAISPCTFPYSTVHVNTM